MIHGWAYLASEPYLFGTNRGIRDVVFGFTVVDEGIRE